MTPSSAQGAGAAPLMGTAGVTSLFFPAIEEEEGCAVDKSAAAGSHAPEQHLQARPAAGRGGREDQCLAEADPAKQARASTPVPEGCSSEGGACAMEAQTPPAAETAPTGDGGDAAAAGVDSIMAGGSEERLPAGDALAIVVSPGLPTP